MAQAGINDITDDDDCLRAEVPDSAAGRRLDQVLAELFPEYSRSRLSAWLKQGLVSVDGGPMRPRDKVFGGEAIELRPEIEAQQRFEAQPIPLDIVYQDEALIVVNKPVGLVVHPAAGNPDGTLLNALLHHDPGLAEVPRAGIVHRLDKDTSGLLVVARTLQAQTALVKQLQSRSMGREYIAVCNGVLTGGGTVDLPMGRHPVDRKRMAVVRGEGKEAITHYRLLQRFRAHSQISVKLETGRTHQIRVHMAHLRYPLVGDAVYGGRLRLPPEASPELVETLRGFKRQALHAAQLSLIHPSTGEEVSWSVPLPEDMQRLIAALEADREAHGGA